MYFGDNLRVLMEEHNMNQKQLAAQLHISASALGNYIRNIREPDYETLKIIASYFNVSLDYLLDFKTNKAHTKKDEYLLHLFRSMTEEQQDIFLEQGLIFVKHNKKKKKEPSTILETVSL